LKPPKKNFGVFCKLLNGVKEGKTEKGAGELSK